MDNLTYNLPPQNLDFEQSLLAGCLLYPAESEEATDILTPTDFYKIAHQKIFKAILDLKDNKIPIDLSTVAERLSSWKILEECGGATYLAQTIEAPIPIKIEYTIQKIREYTVLREAIKICHNTIQNCHNAKDDSEEILDKFQNEVLSIDIKTKPESYVSLKQLVVEGEDRHELIYKNSSNITGAPSGFKDIDMVTCGFQPGDLIVLAARPSMGKSALMRCMSVNMAKKDYPNIIISLEMSKDQLYDTIIASESGVNSTKFRNGYFSKEDWAAKTEAASRLYGLKSFVIDKDCFKTLDICRIIRQIKKKEGIKAVFIDYLQLIEGERNKSKNDEVGGITRRLKQLAKEVSLPIILLCQLNRKCEERGDKRPILSDLRDSGNIEQDADIIMFLYRHEQYIKNKYHKDGKKTDDLIKYEGKAEVNIAKQRMGPIRRINLTWLKKVVTFRDVMPEMIGGPWNTQY